MPAGSADELLHDAAVVDLQSAMETYGQTPANTTSHSHNRLFTAMDMNAEGAKLRYDSALRSSEGAEWKAGANKEFDRLVIDTKTGA
jgi:hypothetical protein